VARTLLLHGLLVIALFFAAALVVVAGHGAWLVARRRWRAPLMLRGRAALQGLAAAPALAPAEVEVLRTLPRAIQRRLLVELAPSLSGAVRETVRGVAEELGVTRYAERLTRSIFWGRRLRGARLLTALGGSERVMLPLFVDPAPAVRAQAAEWAADHPTPTVVAALLGRLADPATLCRFAVQDSLLRLGPAATAPMARYLATGRGAEAAPALEVAAAIPHADFMASALALCHDPHPATRARALGLAAAIGGAEATAAVLERLGDDDPGVRAAAARAVGRLGHWQGAGAVARLLRDGEWEVRQAAGVALRVLGGPGMILLGRYRDGDDPDAADMARQVLDVAAVEAR
jgi:hypothetical protein